MINGRGRVFIDCGKDPYLITFKNSKGKEIEQLFEDHVFCGPMPVWKNGAERIPESSIFWAEVSKWYQQGKKLDGSKCVYDSSIDLN